MLAHDDVEPRVHGTNVETVFGQHLTRNAETVASAGLDADEQRILHEIAAVQKLQALILKLPQNFTDSATLEAWLGGVCAVEPRQRQQRDDDASSAS